MWNCILWGIWFPCSSCTQELTCGSGTGSLCEQMPPFLREAGVCRPSLDSCMGNKCEDTGPKGRGKSLLSHRHVCPGFLGSFDIPQYCFVTQTWVPAPIWGTCTCGGTASLSSCQHPTCQKAFHFWYGPLGLCPIHLHSWREQCTCESCIHPRKLKINIVQIATRVTSTGRARRDACLLATNTIKLRTGSDTRL